MSALGVLVIGAGDMGGRHARHWREAGARVIGIFDPDVDRARQLAQAVGAEAVTDADAFLARSDVEAVSVCTPTFLHARYTVAALAAGKHVLCEKPAALTLPDAERMALAEQESGRILRIGFMRRFDPASQQILEFHQRIGDPVLAQATIAAGIRPKRLMHDAAANGGPIIDMCCHIFDQWAALYGAQPRTVRAQGYTFGEHKIELEGIAHKALDSAHITLSYPGGAVGQIQVSWGLPSGIEALEHHTYMGPEGLITVSWPDRVTLRDGRGRLDWSPPPVDPWRLEIENFHRQLRGLPHTPLATIHDGILALRTSLAVLESVASGREVRPDEVGGDLPDLGSSLGDGASQELHEGAS